MGGEQRTCDSRAAARPSAPTHGARTRGKPVCGSGGSSRSPGDVIVAEARGKEEQPAAPRNDLRRRPRGGEQQRGIATARTGRRLRRDLRRPRAHEDGLAASGHVVEVEDGGDRAAAGAPFLVLAAARVGVPRVMLRRTRRMHGAHVRGAEADRGGGRSEEIGLRWRARLRRRALGLRVVALEAEALVVPLQRRLQAGVGRGVRVERAEQRLQQRELDACAGRRGRGRGPSRRGGGAAEGSGSGGAERGGGAARRPTAPASSARCRSRC